uniref:Uncharacterized protein n=1 Tax=Setaria italica TaxID=4555 RepID=K4AN49_SETIT
MCIVVKWLTVSLHVAVCETMFCIFYPVYHNGTDLS